MFNQQDKEIAQWLAAAAGAATWLQYYSVAVIFVLLTIIAAMPDNVE